MCQKRTAHHLLCNHSYKRKIRCPDYLATPRVPCTYRAFNDTFHSLCPECSGAPKPLSFVSRRAITAPVTSSELKSLAGSKRQKVVNGIKRMNSSIKRRTSDRISRRNRNEKEEDAQSLEQEVNLTSKAESVQGDVRSEAGQSSRPLSQESKVLSQ